MACVCRSDESCFSQCHPQKEEEEDWDKGVERLHVRVITGCSGIRNRAMGILRRDNTACVFFEAAAPFPQY